MAGLKAGSIGSSNTLGSRRNAAQLHALAGVEREVRASDPSGRRKYLRDFSQAFRSYQSIIDAAELRGIVQSADIVLIGDYHALPQSQRWAGRLLEQRAQPGDRPIVLGVEAIYARHQNILDEWWRREIDGEELRHRLRFETEWGYDWAPFLELLVTAREHAEAIYALDCMPREDLRKIGARDRHAADKLAEIRARHPEAVILVLFGESHLTPDHLPAMLAQRLPADRMVTVLQNVDALYWKATGEQQERVEAVRVNANTVCVFNATPLEKYESYRLSLSRWQQEQRQPDIAPTIYNLVDGLLRFLNIDRYSSHNTTQPKFLVDLLPEVANGASEPHLRNLLARETSDVHEDASLRRKIEAQGAAYLPKSNVLYVGEFQMMFAAEEAARFLHQACRGLPVRGGGKHDLSADHRFRLQVLEHALAFCGSRILYPVRPSVRLEGGAEVSHARVTKFMADAKHGPHKFESVTQCLGFVLGSELYDAYVKGCVTPTTLRHLYLAHIEKPKVAQTTFRELLRKLRTSRKKPSGSVTC
jgi:uncharacterized iron-regulated protein